MSPVSFETATRPDPSRLAPSRRSLQKKQAVTVTVFSSPLWCLPGVQSRNVPNRHQFLSKVASGKVKMLTIKGHEAWEEHTLRLNVNVVKMVPVHEYP